MDEVFIVLARRQCLVCLYMVLSSFHILALSGVLGGILFGGKVVDVKYIV